MVPVLPSPSFGTTEVEHVLVASLGGYLAVALFEMDADESQQKLQSLIRWLEHDHSSAVTSLRRRPEGWSSTTPTRTNVSNSAFFIGLLTCPQVQCHERKPGGVGDGAPG
mgnify:CR=1 FL=1|jgi:hypothetical protein